MVRSSISVPNVILKYGNTTQTISNVHHILYFNIILYRGYHATCKNCDVNFIDIRILKLS